MPLHERCHFRLTLYVTSTEKKPQKKIYCTDRCYGTPDERLEAKLNVNSRLTCHQEVKFSHLGGGIARLQRLPRLVAERLQGVGAALSTSPLGLFGALAAVFSSSAAAVLLLCVCASVRRVFSCVQSRGGGWVAGVGYVKHRGASCLGALGHNLFAAV